MTQNITSVKLSTKKTRRNQHVTFFILFLYSRKRESFFQCTTSHVCLYNIHIIMSLYEYFKTINPPKNEDEIFVLVHMISYYYYFCCWCCGIIMYERLSFKKGSMDLTRHSFFYYYYCFFFFSLLWLVLFKFKLFIAFKV